MLFLVASMVPLFGAIIMSSLLLLYIEPLDDSASISFIGPFMVRAAGGGTRGAGGGGCGRLAWAGGRARRGPWDFRAWEHGRAPLLDGYTRA